MRAFEVPTNQIQQTNNYTIPNKTNEQILAEQKSKFNTLAIMTENAMAGKTRSIVAYGGPGTGKSYEVEQILLGNIKVESNSQEKDFLDFFNADGSIKFEKETIPNYRTIKGHISPLGLYRILFEYKNEGDVLVFDDCDSVLSDEKSLNLLKAALDTAKVRKISWIKDRPIKDIPDNFEYNGSVIFITNTDFQKISKNDKHKLAKHLGAILSRAYYIDLSIATIREILIRIRYVTIDCKMLDDILSENQTKEIFEFIENNANKFRDLSLRKVIQVAELRVSNPNNWKELVKDTCFSNEEN